MMTLAVGLAAQADDAEDAKTPANEPGVDARARARRKDLGDDSSVLCVCFCAIQVSTLLLYHCSPITP